MGTWPNPQLSLIFCKMSWWRHFILIFSCFEFHEKFRSWRKFFVIFFRTQPFPPLKFPNFTLGHFVLWSTRWKALTKILKCFGLLRLRSNHPCWKLASERPRSFQSKFPKFHNFRPYLVIVNGWISEWFLHQIKIQFFLVSFDIKNYNYTIN